YTTLSRSGYCRYAAFSPDGRYVVTVGRDRVARVWDAATGQPVTPPLRHDSDVLYAAFTPGGHHLVTAEERGPARVWDLTPSRLPLADLLRLARLTSGRHIDATGASVPRALDPEEWRELRGRYPEAVAPAPPAEALGKKPGPE